MHADVLDMYHVIVAAAATIVATTYITQLVKMRNEHNVRAPLQQLLTYCPRDGQTLLVRSSTPKLIHQHKRAACSAREDAVSAVGYIG